MSARGPFARVVEDSPDSVNPDSVYIGTVCVSSHGCPTIAQKRADAINSAHAARVAEELEAAADAMSNGWKVNEVVGAAAAVARLRARAKAIREGGGK